VQGAGGRQSIEVLDLGAGPCRISDFRSLGLQEPCVERPVGGYSHVQGLAASRGILILARTSALLAPLGSHDDCMKCLFAKVGFPDRSKRMKFLHCTILGGA
jgi:hypothetical protein